MSRAVLEDMKVPVKLKLSALWASLMFFYIYGDYFSLYRPGTVQGMLDGQMGPIGPATQGILLGTSLLMAVPSAMIILSLILPPSINRWANIILGAVYSLLVVFNLAESWAFYVVFGVVEIAMTLLVVAYAWRWPRISDVESQAVGS